MLGVPVNVVVMGLRVGDDGSAAGIARVAILPSTHGGVEHGDDMDARARVQRASSRSNGSEMNKVCNIMRECNRH